MKYPFIGIAVLTGLISQPMMATETNQIKHIPNPTTVAPSQYSDNDDVTFIVQFNEKPLSRMMPQRVGMHAYQISSIQQLNQINSQQVNAIQSLKTKQIPITVRSQFSHALNAISLTTKFQYREQLLKLPNVKSVSLNGTVHTLLDDTVPLIDAANLWDTLDTNGIKVTGKGIRVGVIDTGINYLHPDLGGCIGEFCKVKAGINTTSDIDSVLDGNGHGTHVAGIIAGNGNIKGVAPDADLYAIKVLSDNGSGSFESIIAGIEWALNPDGDVTTDDKLDVINLSLGGPVGDENPMADAVNNAVLAGVIAVVAAGNDGEANYTVGSPGIAEHAITVGSTDKNDNLSYFSSRGPLKTGFINKPDILAPGSDIYSTYKDDYKHLSGTSMASPHVAGAAALLKQKMPDATPLEIKALLMAKAIDIGEPNYNQGAGRLSLTHLAAPNIKLSDTSIYFNSEEETKIWQKTSSINIQNISQAEQNYSFNVLSVPEGVTLTTPAKGVLAADGNSELTITAEVDTSLLKTLGSNISQFVAKAELIVDDQSYKINIYIDNQTTIAFWSEDFTAFNVQMTSQETGIVFDFSKSSFGTVDNTVRFKAPKDTYDVVVKNYDQDDGNLITIFKNVELSKQTTLDIVNKKGWKFSFSNIFEKDGTELQAGSYMLRAERFSILDGKSGKVRYLTEAKELFDLETYTIVGIESGDNVSFEGLVTANDINNGFSVYALNHSFTDFTQDQHIVLDQNNMQFLPLNIDQDYQDRSVQLALHMGGKSYGDDTLSSDQLNPTFFTYNNEKDTQINTYWMTTGVSQNPSLLKFDIGHNFDSWAFQHTKLVTTPWIEVNVDNDIKLYQDRVNDTPLYRLTQQRDDNETLIFSRDSVQWTPHASLNDEGRFTLTSTDGEELIILKDSLYSGHTLEDRISADLRCGNESVHSTENMVTLFNFSNRCDAKSIHYSMPINANAINQLELSYLFGDTGAAPNIETFLIKNGERLEQEVSQSRAQLQLSLNGGEGTELVWYDLSISIDNNEFTSLSTGKDATDLMVPLPLIEGQHIAQLKLRAYNALGNEIILNTADFNLGSNVGNRRDADNDGIPNAADEDIDGDGVINSLDAFPYNHLETTDTDGDGTGDNSDAFPTDPTEWLDTDADGIGNNKDLDDDNDGVNDTDDALPLNPTEWQDTDNDGIGNNIDKDNDGDGVVDVKDAFPLDPNEQRDTDGDGIGNNADPDDDNDGVADEDDAFPLDPNEWHDTDNDGIGDNSDPDIDGDGITNEQEIFWGFDPFDPSDALEDFDNDGMNNRDEILAGLDPTKDDIGPMITLEEIIEVVSTGEFTEVNLGNIWVYDGKDGVIIPTASMENPFPIGQSIVTWTAIDLSGNVSTKDQTVNVIPMISIHAPTMVAEGDPIQIDIDLNGNAPYWPVIVDLVIEGSSDMNDHDLTTRRIRFDEDTLKQIVIGRAHIDEEVETSDNIEASLQNPENAEIDPTNNLAVIKLIDASDQLNPAIQLQQGNQVSRFAYQQNDPIVLLFNNIDLERYLIETQSDTVVANINDSNQLVIDPASIDAGMHQMLFNITDSYDGSLIASLPWSFFFKATTPVLDANTDSDNDGVMDSIEGISDTDRDGIVDYLDANAITNIIPVGSAMANNGYIATHDGAILMLGNYSLEAQQASVPASIINEHLMIDNGEWHPYGNVVDIQINQAALDISVAKIVVPLQLPIERDAALHLLNNDNYWAEFVQTDTDLMMSSTTANCNSLQDSQYQADLVQDANCVLLTVTDGGVNDRDGLVNGQVSFTAGIFGNNTAPYISDFPSSTAKVDSLYQSTMVVVDNESDALTVTVSGLPAWLSFNSESLMFEGTPPASAADSQLVIALSISDGLAVSTDSFTLQIKANNVEPPKTESDSGGSTGILSLLLLSAFGVGHRRNKHH
ncbi:S8 family peptidase [Shewanella donghaensis]|uniref:S8 family peptidase n=1 Tax=Shewanella donghaensis TaxID=238836 RepID=UPI00118364CE|nr:S8 family serine peptidase [Shewanella donghaensis]